MNSSTTETFREKLALLVIDKLVLGLLILLLGFCVNSILTERDRQAEARGFIRNATLAVSQVRTDSVIEQRNAIFTGVRRVVAMINDSRAEGRVSGNNIKVLASNVRQIENAIGQLVAIDPSLSESGASFVKLVNGIQHTLSNLISDPKELRACASRLHDAHAKLMHTLRKTTVSALEAEREAVAKLLDV